MSDKGWASTAEEEAAFGVLPEGSKKGRPGLHGPDGLPLPPLPIGSRCYFLAVFLWCCRLCLSRHDRHAAESLRTILGGAVLIFIGLPIVISPHLSVTLIGVVIFTCRPVIVHSVAFGWAGALAHSDRTEASGTYLVCYYLGSSIVEYIPSLVFHHFG